MCEGPVSGIGRVWADGREIDLAALTWRLHAGSETQDPDGLLVAHIGADETPAYRGLAYIVFERLPLADFGNRLPQLSFEVHRSVDSFETQVRATVLIPGSGEFVYATEPVVRETGAVSAAPENTHTRQGVTDWQVALDQLEAALPNARSTSLVVSWFGTDLRAAHCQIRPAVDSADKATSPLVWSVAGLTRATAAAVSLDDGRPAYGGTPSDQTVIAAIRDLKARGHAVTLTPFILMDIPAANTLPDPYSSSASQPRYPWRGRITLATAPGRPGTADKTAAAAAEIATFVGTAQPSHFAIVGDSVVYSGPEEWSLRRMVLHHAALALAAGGVDAFVIGSELRGLTQLRSGSATYPFVAALQMLAADVKTTLGPATKITYAADWSEYFGHHPADGSGDVFFHLDPLWASAAIDAVAIDCYWPLADWRDGATHLDRLAGARSIHDLSYLKSNIAAGESYDWYYASPADRDSQIRTPITDGAAGKPWVFRYKDMKSWWSNAHFDRPGGVETSSSTAWVPQSKPIWFTELGCPAVDKGANQPNVFVDPKSAESFLPYHSRGQRDDLMQRRYLQAFLEGFDTAHSGYLPGANPTSSVYGGPMLDLTHVHVYAWDARPYPAFPNDTDTWGDGANWRLGHWVNGRIASQSLSEVAAALFRSYGFADHDASALDGLVAGYVVDRSMSAREALQPLELAYFFDARESGGRIVLRHRGADGPAVTLAVEDLVEEKPGSESAAPGPGAGDGIAGGGAHHLCRDRVGLSPGRCAVAPPRRREQPRFRCRARDRHERGEGRLDCRYLAARGVGEPRARELHAAAEQPRSRARRSCFPLDRRSRAGRAPDRGRRSRRARRAGAEHRSRSLCRGQRSRASGCCGCRRHRRHRVGGIFGPAAAHRHGEPVTRLCGGGETAVAGRHRLLSGARRQRLCLDHDRGTTRHDGHNA